MSLQGLLCVFYGSSFKLQDELYTSLNTKIEKKNFYSPHSDHRVMRYHDNFQNLKCKLRLAGADLAFFASKGPIRIIRPLTDLI